ncbi:LOW QUALITY PROTEIN: hypothetical protein, conserved [Eimeria necatrix]|uniref:CRAL-TRIO domain-containing protein n=1 Tax=Eimeria necatrix TaxID=51315 RepID=U6MQH5_9EIME|nr:LOW QUALITY PROTEIN: hypothetical protein, conserved [Eimeria necatrix]CDJ64714.1 hypothetical protein, conserved [Eimeria necatrix]
MRRMRGVGLWVALLLAAAAWLPCCRCSKALQQQQQQGKPPSAAEPRRRYSPPPSRSRAAEPRCNSSKRGGVPPPPPLGAAPQSRAATLRKGASHVDYSLPRLLSARKSGLLRHVERAADSGGGAGGDGRRVPLAGSDAGEVQSQETHAHCGRKHRQEHAGHSEPLFLPLSRSHFQSHPLHQGLRPHPAGLPAALLASHLLVIVNVPSFLAPLLPSIASRIMGIPSSKIAAIAKGSQLTRFMEPKYVPREFGNPAGLSVKHNDENLTASCLMLQEIKTHLGEAALTEDGRALLAQHGPRLLGLADPAAAAAAAAAATTPTAAAAAAAANSQKQEEAPTHFSVQVEESSSAAQQQTSYEESGNFDDID